MIAKHCSWCKTLYFEKIIFFNRHFAMFSSHKVHFCMAIVNSRWTSAARVKILSLKMRIINFLPWLALKILSIKHARNIVHLYSIYGEWLYMENFPFIVQFYARELFIAWKSISFPPFNAFFSFSMFFSTFVVEFLCFFLFYCSFCIFCTFLLVYTVFSFSMTPLKDISVSLQVHLCFSLEKCWLHSIKLLFLLFQLYFMYFDDVF